MTASSGVVLSNLAYLVGAVVLAIIGGLLVWLRHRRPVSVDANVESFHRGLRALAPDIDVRSSVETSQTRIEPQPGGSDLGHGAATGRSRSGTRGGRAGRGGAGGRAERGPAVRRFDTGRVPPGGGASDRAGADAG